MRKLLGFLPLAAMLAAAPALCREASGQLMVSVTVVASCRLSVDTTALSFGSVDQNAGTASASASADLGVRCSSRQPYAIGFDYGEHAAGAQRHMSSGSAQVTYQLYSDASHRHVLGPRGSDGELLGTGDGDEQRLPLYARLDLDRNTPAGNYTDVVRMTVTW